MEGGRRRIARRAFLGFSIALHPFKQRMTVGRY
jgi:hypothetical protein